MCLKHVNREGDDQKSYTCNRYGKPERELELLFKFDLVLFCLFAVELGDVYGYDFAFLLGVEWPVSVTWVLAVDTIGADRIFEWLSNLVSDLSIHPDAIKSTNPCCGHKQKQKREGTEVDAQRVLVISLFAPKTAPSTSNSKATGTTAKLDRMYYDEDPEGKVVEQ